MPPTTKFRTRRVSTFIVSLGLAALSGCEGDKTNETDGAASTTASVTASAATEAAAKSAPLSLRLNELGKEPVELEAKSAVLMSLGREHFLFVANYDLSGYDRVSKVEDTATKEGQMRLKIRLMEKQGDAKTPIEAGSYAPGQDKNVTSIIVYYGKDGREADAGLRKKDAKGAVTIREVGDVVTGSIDFHTEAGEHIKGPFEAKLNKRR